MKVTYIHFETLDSTNNWVKQHAHIFDPHHLSCVTARKQTAGRGRFKRSWLSPKGENIYATFFLTVPFQAPYLANLGQILGYSCYKMLKKKDFKPQLKWPNDILLEGKKVAGILTEAISLKEYIGVALGIGINVDTDQALLETIDRPAISLAQISQKKWKWKELLEALSQELVVNIALLKKDGFKVFQASFEKALAYKDKRITCVEGEKKIQGVCRGVTAQGFLRVEINSGKEIEVSSGEIL